MAHQLENSKPQEYSLAQASIPKQTKQGVDSADDFLDRDRNHWADPALARLIDKYRCVAGFPDRSVTGSPGRTFRGEEPATRFQIISFFEYCLASSIERHVEEHPLPPHEHPPGPHEHPHGLHEHPHGLHEHSIPLWIIVSFLISIITFIIYQYLVLRRIGELERDVKQIGRANKWTTISSVVSLVSGAMGIIATVVPMATQPRNPASSPPQQEAAAGLEQQTPGAAHSEDSGLEDALAALRSSEPPVTQPTTVLTKVSFSTPSQEQLETGIAFSGNLPTTGTSNSP